MRRAALALAVLASLVVSRTLAQTVKESLDVTRQAVETQIR